MSLTLLSSMFQHQANLAQVHTRFLQHRREGLNQMGHLLSQTLQDPNKAIHFNSVATPALQVPTQEISAENQTGIRQIFPTRYSQPKNVVFNEADLKEFAYGKIGKVFGSDYDIIDTYPKRVMLPMDPYLLVSRVTEMNGTRGEFKPSTMTTEYDIPHNAWYSTDGQIPSCICIESGQCDLLLISYMGIDFENKGKYLYRLLDCTLTYLDDQPKEGQTLRYEISINSFARNGHNLLFFFSYECFIGDKMILTMTNGCAGFFSDEELAVGKGVIHTNEEKAERAKVQKQHFEPLLQCQKTSFDRQDMQYLMDGDLAHCFANPAYDKQGKNPSIHFPLEKIMMLDRITSVDAKGGIWGLGELWAEKDLQPDEWYFTSHFRDDPVLAGSLMSEGCVQLLQFFMMYLGFHTKVEDARFQTMRNIPQPIRCRGQVLPKDTLMRYRLEITEIGLSPKPYAKGNVDIYLGDKVIVDFRNVCLELSEKSAEERAMIANCQTICAPEQGVSMPVDNTPIPAPQAVKQTKPALFNEEQIVHFATGEIVSCFGEEFAIYNAEGRRPPRTPNGYLQLMTRVLSVDGKRHELKTESSCVAEYDVPTDVFFCTENSYPSFTPYSMIMEIALQPNGFLTSHMGSTLLYPDTNLYFRNLDGTGELIKDLDLRGKTIVNKTTMYSTSAVMNNIIQKFTFELYCDDELFYKGDAVFGFFTAESLANQVGMDKGDKLAPWFKAENIPANDIIEMDLKNEAGNGFFQAPANKPYYKLAGGKFNFLDEAKIIPQGGKFGKGYVHALKIIDPSDWFYPCHFHQDPVMPGSLGVEGMIQALQVFVLQADLGKDFTNPRFGLVLGKANWQYRGQIIPANKDMTLEVHIKKIEMTDGRLNITADGELWKEGLRIYHVEDIGVSLLEG